MAVRTATARWSGSLQEGDGAMRLGRGAYEGPYSFQSRFEEGEGTNPEELIGAAHAGCFSMAFAGALGRAGHEPESVETEAAKRGCPVSQALAAVETIEVDATLES